MFRECVKGGGGGGQQKMSSIKGRVTRVLPP